jgi:hypothetical protein
LQYPSFYSLLDGLPLRHSAIGYSIAVAIGRGTALPTTATPSSPARRKNVPGVLIKRLSYRPNFERRYF